MPPTSMSPTPVAELLWPFALSLKYVIGIWM
jgi:hypothetical protein